MIKLRIYSHVCALLQVKSMNAVFDTKGQGSLRSVGDLTPTLEAQLHAMRKNKAMSELLMADGSQRATEAPMPGEGDQGRGRAVHMLLWTSCQQCWWWASATA